MEHDELIEKMMKNQQAMMDSYRERIDFEVRYGLFSPYIPLKTSSGLDKPVNQFRQLTEPCRGCGASETVVHAGQRLCSYCRRTR